MSTKAMTISAAVLVFLLALGLTLYPLISNQYNQQHQSQIHTAYQEQVEQMEDEDILVARTMAVAYNEVLKPGVQDRDAYSRDALLVLPIPMRDGIPGLCPSGRFYRNRNR